MKLREREVNHFAYSFKWLDELLMNLKEFWKEKVVV
jgi:hypothetical protein